MDNDKMSDAVPSEAEIVAQIQQQLRTASSTANNERLLAVRGRLELYEQGLRLRSRAEVAARLGVIEWAAVPDIDDLALRLVSAVEALVFTDAPGVIDEAHGAEVSVTEALTVNQIGFGLEWLEKLIGSRAALTIIGGVSMAERLVWLRSGLKGQIEWQETRHAQLMADRISRTTIAAAIVLKGTMASGQTKAVVAALRQQGIPFAQVATPGCGQLLQALRLLNVEAQREAEKS